MRPTVVSTLLVLKEGLTVGPERWGLLWWSAALGDPGVVDGPAVVSTPVPRCSRGTHCGGASEGACCGPRCGTWNPGVVDG
jgi:hypothetical protein